ncbi:MAG: slipin family protein [Pseudomonadota bacterium]
MLGFNKVVIADYERGLKYVNRRLVDVIEPGVYRWFSLASRKTRVELVDVTDGRLSIARADYLIRRANATVAKHFEVVDIDAQEVGLIYRNGKLDGLLKPGQSVVLWRATTELKVERASLAETLDVDTKLFMDIQNSALSVQEKRAVYFSEVADHEVGLLMVDGALERVLSPSAYAFWTLTKAVSVERIDTRMQALEVSGQEMLTKDKVSLRINLAANYRVIDAVKARVEQKDIGQHLYRELQFGLRQAVGVKTLDELLVHKGELDRDVFSHVNSVMAETGLTVHSVGVKDIILPGDMKDILNKVVEAQKASEANVVRRREETAATRSLLNTAKLMDSNPTLLRLKELEMLEKVTEKINQITVYGGLDGVLNELVKIGGRP